ncbi:MAG: hypothetical protein K9G33_15470 [Sneathiella sp.]|nr:hypothetical protein [Sneathiella sp.]
MKENDSISKLAASLKEEGIAEFLAGAGKEFSGAPRIDSRWHIDTVCQPSARTAALEARHFGKDAIDQIDKFAEDVRAYYPPTDSVRRCQILLDLADWIASETGYGNLFIAARCHDLAAVEIGRLIADAGLPLGTGQGLLERSNAAWYAPEVRAAVLNREAGAVLFRAHLALITQQDLDAVWKLGVLCELEEQNPQLKIARQGIPPKGLEPWKDISASISTSFKSHAEIERNAAFFRDDPYNAGNTLSETWELKHHMRLVVGLRPRSFHDLAALAAFRKAVGYFPERAPRGGHPFGSEGEAAFDEAWRPHATPANHTTYVRAWATYSQIQNRQFLDTESRR